MVNLNNKSKEQLKKFLNLNHEVAGKLHRESVLIINNFITRGPKATGNRGTVNIPEHINRYHTHPRITFPVPSAENILSSIHKKSRRFSLIVTAWGIFIIENKNYNKNTILSRQLYNTYGVLYKQHCNQLFPLLKQIIDYLVYNIMLALPYKAQDKTARINGSLKKIFGEFLEGINRQFHLYFHLTFIPW